MKLTDRLWFDVYGKQDYSETPFSNHLEAGLSYPQRNFKGIFNISESLVNPQEFTGNILLQIQDNKTLETKFVITNSKQFTGFGFNSIVKIMNTELIVFQGNIKVEIDKKSTLFDLTFYQTNKTEKAGALLNDNDNYSGRIVYRNNQEEKKLYFDINIFQNVYLNLNYKQNLGTTKLDFMWDRKKDPNKRIYFETFLKPGNFNGQIQILEIEGRVNISYTPSHFNILLEVNRNFIDIEANIRLFLNEINLLLGIKSSFSSASNVRTHFVLSQDSDQDGSKKVTFLVSFLN